MKKRRQQNLGMLLIIVLIITAGFFITGYIKGWFLGDQPFVLSEKTGIVTLERKGLAYQIKNENAIYKKDVLSTNDTSTAEISKDKQPFLWLADQTALAVENEDPATFLLAGGEMFADGRIVDHQMNFDVFKTTVYAENAVWSASMQKGSLSIRVYYGKVSVDGYQEEQTVAAGEQLSVIQTADNDVDEEIVRMQAVALNDFELGRLHLLTGAGFCFSKDDIDTVREKRENDKVKAKQADLLADHASKKTAGDDTEETETEEKKDLKFSYKKKKKTKTEESTETETTADTQTVRKETEEKQSKTTEKEDTEKPQKPQETKKTDTPVETETKTEDEKQPDTQTYCTIEIRCDTILDHMGELSAGKEGYVPSDGTILTASKIAFSEGETVFDVLKRACDLAGIQLEYSYTPLYESYYVEGIGQLYEFDCGSESGWMYKVNGWFPNYGCSAYKVKENDEIVFCYTCKGLGADVGGGTY